MMLKRTVILSALLAVSAAGLAEPVRYTPDKWHTRIYFTVDHMGLSRYQGRFKDFTIEFMVD